MLNSTFKILDCTTNSGKQVISFECSHCHNRYSLFHLSGYFYETKINKDNLEQALQVFVDSINTHTEIKMFNKPKTAIKLRGYVCNCDPKIVDFERFKGFKRAKDILRRAQEIIDNQD